MERILFLLFWNAITLPVALARGGFYADYIDPKTGCIDDKKVFSEINADPTVGFPVDYKQVKSIQQDGDNRIVLTFGDGSKKVYERNVFKPEEGWKRTY